MTSASDWNARTGQSWAREWQRTDRSFGVLTGRLIEMASREPFSHALDIGCGAGETSILLAREGGNRVTGVDISAELLAVARQRGEGIAGLEFVEAGADRWQAPAGEEPDLLLSRHGVMFFDDPHEAFAALRLNSAPGARMVFTCFRSRAENGWVSALDAVFDDPSPPAPTAGPGPFAFGDRGYISGLLAGAGWSEIAIHPFDYAMIAGAGPDPVGDAASYFRRIGPAAGRIAELDGAAREAAVDRLEAMLEDHLDDGMVTLPSAAWIVETRSTLAG